jgi:excinuclease ABC subunit B
VERIQALRQEMFLAAENLEFEKAARLRDELRKLQAELGPAGAAQVPEAAAPRAAARGARGAAKKRPSKPGKASRRRAN